MIKYIFILLIKIILTETIDLSDWQIDYSLDKLKIESTSYKSVLNTIIESFIYNYEHQGQSNNK